jgi:hypothetical protein
LANIHHAIHNLCSTEEVAVIVDGDDELIGFNTLAVLNSVYRAEKLGLVYSNFYYMNQQKTIVQRGFNE